jgi:hypothetical protein
LIHRRQPTLGGQIYEASSLSEKNWACQHDQCIGARLGHVGECLFEIVWPSRLNELKPDPERLRCGFCSLQRVLFCAHA